MVARVRTGIVYSGMIR